MTQFTYRSTSNYAKYLRRKKASQKAWEGFWGIAILVAYAVGFIMLLFIKQ